ncbi:MAG: leucine--tRNA ligase [Phycisphaeraceae bacterium]|nr:MAG: leucine--tRNA ligase [Phycisphaeraceae bacterium]
MPPPNPADDSTPSTEHAPEPRAGAEDAPFRYTAALADRIETAWQERWDREGTFVQPNPGRPGFDATRPKFYCLDMFPYPSGAGLHVGHPEGYTATDILCRYKRMKGFNVLHPMGWDAFGLPAEQYAIQTGVHPALTTRASIGTFRRQLKRFGFSYDWTRELGTIDPSFYRWTQWIFLRLYDAWFDPDAKKARPIADLIARERAKGPAREGGAWDALPPHEQRAFLDAHRLAYLGESTVNWCPRLGTVLANDEVIDGRSERGGHPVFRKPLRQWMFRITAYADRLLDQLDGLEWPASTKAMQAEWIGRSEGAEIDFSVSGMGSPLRVFTTRPDTIFGATYMVVAPEHPLVAHALAHPTPRTDAALRAYAEGASRRSDLERMESKDKTGVDSGLDAINPATGQPIPVWVADYVLMGYGTGAIMAVPAHDQRDFDFARAFGLPIRDVVYDRARLAMATFARLAPDEARSPERWQGALASFLGLVVSENTPPERFAEALRGVLTRRQSGDGTSVAINLDARRDEAPGAVGRQRGVTEINWLDALEDLGLASFDDLAGRFEGAVFFDRWGQAFPAAGFAVNSSGPGLSLDALPTDRAKDAVIEWLGRTGRGRRRVNYRFRDWTFSRQRYWGEPFPIVYTHDGTPYPVADRALPVTLPELADYAPLESDDPTPLLAKAAEWANTTAGEAGVDPALLPPHTPVRRECNTMPGSAGSSWYMVRYCDPSNELALVDPAADRYWLGPAPGERFGGVDLYMGGAEHAVGHLLYARFWQNVLHDLGYLASPEPFKRLYHQGLITSFAYQRPDKTLVPSDTVDEAGDGRYVERGTGVVLTQVTAKMSKSLKNVVNPDDVIAEYGADTFRLYEMYMGPLDASKPWNPRDITGLFRFLARAWRLAVDERTGRVRLADAPDPAVEKLLHRTIAKVGDDIERLAFNTAIAAMIGFVNAAGQGPLTRDQLGRFTLVLAPFAPHLAEELWSRLGNARSLAAEGWPEHDPAMLRDDEVELAVQVLGKVRGKITVPAGAGPADAEAAALANPEVQKWLAGKTPRKVIVVPGRLVNIVV